VSAIEKLTRAFAAAGGREPLRVLAASGQLGFGIPEAAFRAGLDRNPHVIGADMGSIDPGPAYLGSGSMATTPTMTERDLRLVLMGARGLDVPLLIGSAGTAGTASQLSATLDLVREIATEEGLHFKLASIAADMPRQRIMRALEDGAVTPIGAIDPLDPETVAGAANIVGQMGIEAFQRALASAADVVVAGRACDTAVFAAAPVMLGFPIAPAMHMAKIIECTSLCCEPGGRDAMLGTLDGDGFVLESMNPDRRATPASVAAHGLYEQADPFSVAEPEGVLHLAEARYEAVNERSVRVSGARWETAVRPSVKIEGASWLGERAVMLAAAADARFIERVDEILESVEAITREILPPDPEYPYRLYFRRYGLDGVVAWPTAPAAPPREIFILGECVARDANEARSVIAVARQHLLHHGFPGRLTTGGNLAFPLTPPELDAGSAYRFSVYHIMELDGADELTALFPVRTEEV
jgi:hypothetical protein